MKMIRIPLVSKHLLTRASTSPADQGVHISFVRSVGVANTTREAGKRPTSAGETMIEGRSGWLSNGYALMGINLQWLINTD